jgi:hypothetical protein
LRRATSFKEEIADEGHIPEEIQHQQRFCRNLTSRNTKIIIEMKTLDLFQATKGQQSYAWGKEGKCYLETLVPKDMLVRFQAI